MFKYSGIKINSNLSTKEFLSIFLVAFLATIFVNGWVIKEFIEIRNYEKTEAVIINTYTTPSTRRMEKHYIKVEYDYLGKTYTNQLRAFKFEPRKVGDKITVIINPNDNSQLVEYYYRYFKMFAGIILAIISIFCFKVYRISKKKYTY